MEPATPTTLSVLFADDHILVLDKPAGLPVHPSSRYLVGTVVNRLRERFGANHAAPVHRLDRETSGVLLCARHRGAARALSQAFARGAVRKVYWALCAGCLPAAQLSCVWPLAVGGPVIRIGVRLDAVAGRPARTTVRLRGHRHGRGGPLSWVEARPATGRRHQVRAHLAALGAPVVGDKIYGVSPYLYERFAAGALSAADRRALRLPRQALHAAALAFRHPADGRPMAFAAPWPDDLGRLWHDDVAAWDDAGARPAQ